jgi:Rieske Fe-S protein
MKLDESYVARRRFLCGMLCGGTAVLGAGMALPVLQYAANVQPSPLPDFLVLQPEEFDLPAGKARMVLYGHVPALLIRLEKPDSPLRAFVATCTHLNCTVTYQEDHRRIYCACHEGSFDLEGRVLAGPPPQPLRQFFTRLHDGKLVLAMEQQNLDQATL